MKFDHRIVLAVASVIRNRLSVESLIWTFGIDE